MALDAKLLEILACPQDKGPLYYLEGEQLLYNPRLQRRYQVRDDIPVMLIDQASTATDEEHAQYMHIIETIGIQPTFVA